MRTFQEYSAYYDLIYKDKDYLEETDYIANIIKQNSNNAVSLLNMGCGTGRHDYLLAGKGFDVTGVDLSENMIELAKNKSQDYKLVNKPIFLYGDIRSLVLGKKFDVITALFHVLSYQTTNNDLKRTFMTASEHVEEDGIFLFDCWYGPGVLTDRPAKREKKFENELLSIKRNSTPVIHPNDNCVDVTFDVKIHDKKSGKRFLLHEVHKMRYLFLPELLMLADLSGFEIIKSETWMTGAPLSFSSWNAVFVCKKTGRR